MLKTVLTILAPIYVIQEVRMNQFVAERNIEEKSSSNFQLKC
jgi:hypothetical protein